jgi:alpha-tubulin suppressor-like RCC1 family protein
MRIRSPTPIRSTVHPVLVHPVLRASSIMCVRKVVGAFSLVALLAVPAGANASSRGSLALTTTGLPSGQRASVVVIGAGFHHLVRTTHASFGNLRPGHYVIAVRPVVITRATSRVHAGATAYPTSSRLVANVKAGKVKKLAISYSAVVNPNVQPLPSGVLGFTGDPKDPNAVMLPGRLRPPSVGTIFTSGPTAALPSGLISKVTATKHRGNRLIVSLRAVPLGEAIPELTFSGSLPLTLSSGVTRELGSSIAAQAARMPAAHAANACHPSSLVTFGAHLDSVELRQAFLGAWPPQMRLTLAVRSTESLGVAAAAVGINCDWTLGEIGPYQGAIPVGPVVIPVYATLPVNAGIHVNGTLNAGTINVASTTVATAAAGFDETKASLTQQGSNVWLSGAPSISGSAKFSTSIGLQAGIGIAKGANVHLEADFGPELDWSSGQSCNLLLDFGSLSAGVAVFGHNLNTPSFTPFQLHLWSGCQRAGGGGGGAGAGGGPGGGGGGGGSPFTNATQVSPGGTATCSLLLSGGVDCWGSNFWGELGNGSTAQSDVPVAASAISNAIQVAAGSVDPTFGDNACALLSSGRIECWGGNENGQLGNGETVHMSDIPVAVSGITSATQVSVSGFNKACAVLTSGTTKCWGFGPLGDGTPSDSNVPVTVSGISSATQVAAGANHTCARLSSGSVQCWGLNGAGQLGDSGKTESDVPVTVTGISTAIQVAAGGNTTCALLSGGGVRCWGADNAGGTNTTPQPVGGITSATGITVGGESACALLSSGSVQCWGGNGSGQLGDGTTTSNAMPVPVSEISTATQVTAGGQDACAVLEGGSIQCWGRNSSGQLGDGNAIDSHVPVAVTTPG